MFFFWNLSFLVCKRIKRDWTKWGLYSRISYPKLIILPKRHQRDRLSWVPALSECSYYLPLPHPVFLFWSSSSSLLCQTGWWLDRDSTGHRRWKPLLPECFSICSERQSGNNMHICLYIWNAHSLLYATVLKSFWWGMMRVSSLFTAISWRKKKLFSFFFHSPLYFNPL